MSRMLLSALGWFWFTNLIPINLLEHPNKSCCCQHSPLQSSASSTLAIMWTFPNADLSRSLPGFKIPSLPPYALTPSSSSSNFLASKTRLIMVGPPVSSPSSSASHPQQWDALGVLSCLHCGTVHSVPPPQKVLLPQWASPGPSAATRQQLGQI